MSAHASILDCTLRDGGYLIDKKFGNSNIKGIIAGLVKAKIDYIEIGFLQDTGFGDGKTIFKNSEDAKKFVPRMKNGSCFTVLADCSRYSVENLDEHRDDSIDAIRECFFKNEKKKAIENCKIIKQKGYKCFVQPVDILGYSDLELIELIQDINEIEPYCFSIVDTFGSMYQEDLHRVFEIINHNLIDTCKIGFHSHNNMQLSNALSQEFIRIAYGKRDVIIDGTLNGMGRGAGNTPTELIAQYMVSQLNYGYDMDAILDVIDDYMDNIRLKCRWGYSTPYFIAGSYGAHVNNIAYLTEKNSIRSKDIRFILNRIGQDKRKRYDYDLLEDTYMQYLDCDIDDSVAIDKLRNKLSARKILLLAPGHSLIIEKKKLFEYIQKNNPIIISVNFLPDEFKADYVYISNMRRYSYWEKNENFDKYKKIIASNIKQEASENELIVSFRQLIKCGYEHIDNSVLMVLRLLDRFDIEELAIAGFDGYSNDEDDNYVCEDMEIAKVRDNPQMLNEEIRAMFADYMHTRTHKFNIFFLTDSRFDLGE